MVEIIILTAAVVIFRRQIVRGAKKTVTGAGRVVPNRNPEAKQLAEYADRLYADKKWLAAEKTYLKLLKLEHNNVTAYSHLGVIYALQKNYPDAIECFSNAVSLQPGASTYHNLGLVYLDKKNYAKAEQAFLKAIEYSPSASRYIALSRAYRGLGQRDKTQDALAKAAELEPGNKTVQKLTEQKPSGPVKVAAAK